MTSAEATRQGFLEQAIAKGEQAAPYLREGSKLRSALQNVTENSPPQAVGLEPMRLGGRALWLQPEVPTLAC